MKQYVKKLVPITAVQYSDTDEAISELQELGLDPYRVKYPEKKLVVRTADGETTANEGDYVVKGVNGDITLCRRDVFEENYVQYEPCCSSS